MQPIYNLAWFITPKPALLWIGRAGVEYPRSLELEPVKSERQAQGVNFARLSEAKQVMKWHGLNETYYKVLISERWVQIEPPATVKLSRQQLTTIQE